MKSVMLSIKPKYCRLIARGEKNIEVRKTRPTIETPFKCYIYCTKEKYNGRFLHTSDKNGCLLFWIDKNDCTIIRQPEDISYTAYTCNGKVIGEFVCDEIFDYEYFEANCTAGIYEGYAITECTELNINDCHCLTSKELLNYGKGKPIYGWHISDLVIYDEPKKLSDFGLTRPPQSWCYVEEYEY